MVIFKLNKNKPFSNCTFYRWIPASVEVCWRLKRIYICIKSSLNFS